MGIYILKERYAIQKQLAKNAGRRTWLARDLQTKELVVIKLLIFGENFQWDDLKLFEREAQTLQFISHPAIPRYLNYFDVDTSIGKGFALVQSYIPAKSLDKWLKSGQRFNEENVKQLAQALLEILRYLHGQQPPVIHRDIKPSNILLANRLGNSIGQVYLVDFGSVQTLAAKQGSTITVVGTYGYMPPEQFGGRTVPASDLYSLGATLIYLVTGRHPAELPQENLRIQFESSVHLSPNLIDWLKWMIQPSLNRRLSSAEEALKALEQPRQQTDHSVLKQKPFGSQIQVRKDGKTVEIYIAPARFRSRILISKIMRDTNCLLPTLMGLIFCSVGLLSCFISVFSLIPGIIFFCAGWFLIVHISPALNIFFESIMVRIKKESLSWTYEWTHELISNWKKSQDALISKKDIKQLIYSNGYWQTTKIKKGTNTMLIPPTITIVAQGEHKFSVYHLSDPEMEWLAHEISEWSGVPITVKYGR